MYAATTPPTRTAVTPTKLAPVKFTTVPAGPDTGSKPEIVGTTPNGVGLVAGPFGTVTVTTPVTARAGTWTSIWFGDTCVKVGAVTAPNLTAVAPPSVVPLIAIVSPPDPLFGKNDVILGATVKTALEVVLPLRQTSRAGH